MNKKRIKSNEAKKGQAQNRSLPSELSNLLFMTVEHIHNNGGNFNIYEKLQYLHRYVKLLDKYISERDIKNALQVQVLLDHAFYNLGLGKPLYLQWAAAKGGRTSKEKKGIINVIEQLLRKNKIPSPARMWKYLATNYDNPEKEDRSIWTTDLLYKVWFSRDIISDKSNGGLLYQQGFDGAEKSIKFKTFEALFYKVRIKMGLLPD